MKKNKAQRTRTAQPQAQVQAPALRITDPVMVRILVVVQLVILAWYFTPQLDSNGDNASYYILGSSLKQGKGYLDLSRPEQPVESQYPIVFPALIALAQLPATNPLLPKVVFAFCGILVTLLCYHTFASHAGSLILPLLALCVFSAAITQYSVILMAEIPYLVLSLLALYLLDKSNAAPHNRGLFWLSAIVALTPMNCRSIGLAFSAAWIIGNLLDRRYAQALVHAGLIVLVAILFRSFTSWDNPYLLQLFQKNSYDPELGYVNAAEMVTRIGQNIAKLAAQVIPSAMFPLSNSWAPALKNTFAKVLLGLVAAGWVQGLFGRLRLVSLYLFFYLGIMSVWQVQWTSERFIVAIVPILYLFMLRGFVTIASLCSTASHGRTLTQFAGAISSVTFSQPLRRIVTVVLLCLCSLIAVANVGTLVRTRSQKEQLGADWRNYYSCADWVRLNTAPSAIVVSRKPNLFYLRSNRVGMAYPFSHDIEKMIAFFTDNGVTHVVFDNFAWTRTTARYLQPALSAHPELFSVVYALRNPDTFVLEFKAP